jgi:hypothetical protein
MVRARILEVEELTQSTKPEVVNRDIIMYCILSLTYVQAAPYPHGSPSWVNQRYYFHDYDFCDVTLRRHQAFAAQEVLNDIVSRRLIVMEIQAMPCVRLDMSLKILSRDIREVFLNRSWDGWQLRVAGCEAVAAAVGEVICCAQVFSMEELSYASYGHLLGQLTTCENHYWPLIRVLRRNAS